MTRQHTAWRPSDETEATGTLAGFVEWLRATGRRPAATPRDIQDWATQERSGFHAAVAAFAGLRRDAPLASALPQGGRIVLVTVATDGARTEWTRDRLRSTPPPQLAMLADAPAAPLAASHLLGLDLRPDDVLHWTGDPAEVWPFGAWIAGACVVLGGPANGVRHSYGVRPVTWAD